MSFLPSWDFTSNLALKWFISEAFFPASAKLVFKELNLTQEN